MTTDTTPLPSFKLISASASGVRQLSTHATKVVALNNSDTPHIFTYDEYDKFITTHTNTNLTCYKPSIPIKKFITYSVLFILLIGSIFIITYFAFEKKRYGIFTFIFLPFILLYGSHNLLMKYIEDIGPSDSVYIIQKS